MVFSGECDLESNQESRKSEVENKKALITINEMSDELSLRTFFFINERRFS